MNTIPHFFADCEWYHECGEVFEDDDGESSYEDEQRSLRGTSECDGLCIPQCDWCLVGHQCPDECAGGECPYETLEKRGSE